MLKIASGTKICVKYYLLKTIILSLNTEMKQLLLVCPTEKGVESAKN